LTVPVIQFTGVAVGGTGEKVTVGVNVIQLVNVLVGVIVKVGVYQVPVGVGVEVKVTVGEPEAGLPAGVEAGGTAEGPVAVKPFIQPVKPITVDRAKRAARQ